MNIIAWILITFGTLGFLGNITSGTGTIGAGILGVAFIIGGVFLKKKFKKNKI